MLFHAHMHHSNLLASDVEGYRVLGSVLPDAAITGLFGWDTLHGSERINTFARHIAGQPHAGSLVNGLGNHHQLDSLSHDAFEGGKGYAFSHQTAALVALVGAACGITDGGTAKRITHNVIESAVDYNLLRAKPELQAAHHQQLQTLDTERAAQWVATYTGAQPSRTAQSLERYLQLVTAYDLAKIQGWVDLWSAVIPELLGTQVDTVQLERALNEAVQETKKDYARLFIEAS